MRFLLLLVCAVALSTCHTFAGTNRLTAAAIMRSASSTNISRVLWRPPGDQVSYLRPVKRGDRTDSLLCAYDIEHGQEIVLLDPGARRFTNALTLSGYQWFPDGSAILISAKGDLHRIELPTGIARRLTTDGGAKEFPTISPDGSQVAFVQKNNLQVAAVATGKQKQLTSDGSETIFNGKLDWVYAEEFNTVSPTLRGFEWSPDGKRIVFLRLDQSPVPEYPITDFVRTHPSVQRQRYPKAGDSNSFPSVRVVEVTASRARPRIMPLGTNVEYIVPEFTWTPDSGEAVVQTLNRAQTELKVLAWNPTSRALPRLLLTDRDDTWINVFECPRFLPRSTNFLWLSARDGWLHSYLQTASDLHQLTRGAWEIEASLSLGWSGQPVQVTPDGEWLYFTANEKDPRERHLYRMKMDGHGFTRLTQEPGTHLGKLSPDGRHVLENFSSVDQPTAIRILRANGMLVATLDQQSDRWRDFAMPRTEFHEVTARDGTRLYAQLTKPSDFDPAKQYPVVVYVYGGPHAQVVRNVHGHVSTRNQLLAEAGFLVWSLDGRGSWGRGHVWESVIFKNCGTNELRDQLDGLAYLRTLPFVDTNRFGIWGWSYGGYMTLYSLTHAPDTFRCGVAGAPVTDWKFYDTIYTERYMSTPKENPTGYKSSSPLAAADRLKSRVLIIHGTADDNVHMQNTMAFIDALAKKGKPYELQIQPGQMHGFGGEAQTRFLAEQIVDFFKRNL